MHWRTRRPVCSALLALLLSGSVLIGRADAAQLVSAADLLSRLDRAIASATEGRGSPTRSRMTEIRSTLGLPLDVDVHGVVVPIADDRLLHRLTGTEERDFDAALAHLHALRAGLDALINAHPAPVPDVAAALRGTQTNPGLFQRAREMWDRLLAWLQSGLESVASSGWGAIVFVAAAVAIAGSLIFVFVRRVRVVQDRSAGVLVPSTAADPSEELAAALRRGDLDAAVRAQFALLAHELALGGLVPEGPALTAGECRRAVRTRRGALYPVVREATDAFERVVYGHVRPTEEHVQVLRRATDAVRAA